MLGTVDEKGYKMSRILGDVGLQHPVIHWQDAIACCLK